LRKITTFPALAIAVLAFAAAGCGDDETTTDSGASGATGASGPPLSQEEFVSEGNAICKAGNKEIEQAASETFSGQPTPAQVEQFATDAAIPSIQGQIDAIRALQPPEDVAGDVETFLNDAQDALDQVQDDPQLLAAEGNADPFADVGDEADAIGLDECAS
jgi:hypothetical protein